jgi:hypothetical protein
MNAQAESDNGTTIPSQTIANENSPWLPRLPAGGI